MLCTVQVSCANRLASVAYCVALAGPTTCTPAQRGKYGGASSGARLQHSTHLSGSGGKSVKKSSARSSNTGTLQREPSHTGSAGRHRSKARGPQEGERIRGKGMHRDHERSIRTGGTTSTRGRVGAVRRTGAMSRCPCSQRRCHQRCSAKGTVYPRQAVRRTKGNHV